MKAQDKQERFADRDTWWINSRAPFDYTVAAYNISREPLLRELEGGHVTRNRYSAECLNSPILFAADIDFRTDDDKLVCRDIVREVFRHQDMSCEIKVEPLRMVEKRLREVIADPVGEEMRDCGNQRARQSGAYDLVSCMVSDGNHGDPALALLFLERLGYFQGLGFRLYESHNGFRVICSSTVFGLRTGSEKAVAGHLQERLFCDRAYRYICAEQGLFRLRLTPKPWRSYDGTGRAARFVGTYGSEKIDPRLAPLIAEHDRVACVDQLGRTDAVLA